MFTGIIEGIGAVKRLTKRGGNALLEIETSMALDDVRVGDSIAVSGACLTVTGKWKNGFSADISSETLSRTNLSLLRAGEKVNLEKSLRLNSFLGGHLVLGHVDGTGTIKKKTPRETHTEMIIEVEPSLSRYIVEKGSIAVEGVSLTVNRCEKNRFYVNIIPQTAQNTTLGLKKVADLVNIETDIIGKYVEKFILWGKNTGTDLYEAYGFIKKEEKI